MPQPPKFDDFCNKFIEEWNNIPPDELAKIDKGSFAILLFLRYIKSLGYYEDSSDKMRLKAI